MRKEVPQADPLSGPAPSSQSSAGGPKGFPQGVPPAGPGRRPGAEDLRVALVVKLCLFVAIVTLGARNRFRHLADAVAAVVGLRRVLRAEVAFGAAVLAAAVRAGLPPSASVAAAAKLQRPASVTVTGSDFGTPVCVRLDVSPGAAGPNRFDVTVVDYDSHRPVSADSISLRFLLEGRPDVAATPLDLTRDPDGHWRGSASTLWIDGTWTVTAVVQSRSDAFEVPMKLMTTGRPK